MNTQELLRAIGGQAFIARDCEISDAAVSQWVSAGEIPSARDKYLRLKCPGSHWLEYDTYLESLGKGHLVPAPVDLPAKAVRAVVLDAMLDSLLDCPTSEL